MAAPTTADSLRLLEYRCTACKGERPVDEVHACASISMVRHGVFTYHGFEGPRLLVPGAVLLGSAGQGYACTHEHMGGDVCLSVELSSEQLEELAAEVAPGSLRRCAFTRSVLAPTPRLEAARQLLEDRARGGDGNLGWQEAALRCAAIALAATVGGAAARRRYTAADRDRAFAGAAFLDANAAQPVSLSDVAAAAGTSPFHFLRAFRGELGITPHQFLIGARLRRAVELLRCTSMPVTAIAYDSGFSDLSNFTNTFRRRIGVSPRAFRRRGLRA